MAVSLTGSFYGSTTSSIVLATTTLGPVTASDLAHQLRFGQGPNTDAEKSESNSSELRQALRQEAYEQVLFKLAKEQKLTEEPALKAELAMLQDDFLLRIANNDLVEIPSQPTANEFEKYIAEKKATLPPKVSVTWRHLLFAVGPKAEDTGIRRAQTSATLAKAAVLKGGTFERAGKEYGAAEEDDAPAGRVMGPAVVHNAVFPELERLLTDSPVGTISDVTNTPVGSLVVQVLERTTVPLTRKEEWQLSADWLQQRREEFRAQLLDKLTKQFPVEVVVPTHENLPTSTTLAAVGSRRITVADIQERSQLSMNPLQKAKDLMTTAGLNSIAEELLLLNALDATGITTSPQLKEKLEWRARFRIVEEMQRHLENQGSPKPPDSELEKFLASNEELFNRPFYSGIVLEIDLKSLSQSLGSTYGLHLKSAVDEIRAQFRETGSSVPVISKTLNLSSGTLTATAFHDQFDMEFPQLLRDAIVRTPAGEVSPPVWTSKKAYLMRVKEVNIKLPPFQKIRSSVLAQYQKENAAQPMTQDAILAKYKYRQVVPVESLRWDPASQTLSVTGAADTTSRQ